MLGAGLYIKASAVYNTKLARVYISIHDRPTTQTNEVTRSHKLTG